MAECSPRATLIFVLSTSIKGRETHSLTHLHALRVDKKIKTKSGKKNNPKSDSCSVKLLKMSKNAAIYIICLQMIKVVQIQKINTSAFKNLELNTKKNNKISLFQFS